MGNCLFGGLGDEEDLLTKVIKSDGEVLEFYCPVTAGSVSHEFADHALFSALDLLWKPLPNHHLLVPGQSYYLFPKIASEELKTFVGSCHVRSNSESFSATMTPYRMSLDYNHRVLKRSCTDVFSRNNYTRTRQKEKRTRRRRTSSKSGIWKVKLVINTEELLQILSEDGRINELIESVRVVAKGENGVTSSITSGSSENVLSVVHTLDFD
ncbi:PREDICTED: uncharacterized protein LOC104773686 [Camelina sativa]|uniref:Uncharacterized protein LOC104773686 n=1 Tax=Camelina sativa TaxID=90675 RepID=A0ABM0Y791_CAMSA|nr:PREDICTED: uncharacterized protein LOC104773686 [Camelina sativa]